LNIGEKLKNKREEKGISIEEIQKRTKIRTKYLKAIEENDFKVIPGNVYVKAFIKEYARQIEIDEKELINEYQNIVNVKNIKEVKEIKKDEEKSQENNIKKVYKYIIIAVSITVLIISTLYIAKILFKNNNEIEKNEDLVESVVTSKNKDEYNNINNNIDNIVKDETNNKITIIAEDKSWIKVTEDGKEVLQDFINPGDNKDFTIDNNLEVKIGNAAGIKIKAGNKIIGPFGDEGEVIKLGIKISKEHIN